MSTQFDEHKEKLLTRLEFLNPLYDKSSGNTKKARQIGMNRREKCEPNFCVDLREVLQLKMMPLSVSFRFHAGIRAR